MGDAPSMCRICARAACVGCARVTWSPDRRLGILLLAAAAGTNVPTPLLLVYRDELDLSDASLTAIFGVYALGLMLALAVAGQAADRWGRRRVALPAAIALRRRVAVLRPRTGQRGAALRRTVPPGRGLGDGVQRRQRMARGDRRAARSYVGAAHGGGHHDRRLRDRPYRGRADRPVGSVAARAPLPPARGRTRDRGRGGVVGCRDPGPATDRAPGGPSGSLPPCAVCAPPHS